jgi:hypothetical protein
MLRKRKMFRLSGMEICMLPILFALVAAGPFYGAEPGFRAIIYLTTVLVPFLLLGCRGAGLALLVLLLCCAAVYLPELAAT